MVHIVLDLEMNKLDKKYKEERNICIREIIEIGAIALDDKFTEIGSFITLVKPEYNDVINPHIVDLTGISTEMVQDAPCFSQALGMFTDWVRNYNQEVSMYEWSDSDKEQLEKEIELKHVSGDDLLSIINWEWHDLQKEYGELLGLERPISLKQAIDYAGFDFEGRQHDALFDARNTAYLLSLSRDENRFEKTMKNVLDALKPKDIPCTLGSMFDFSKIMLQGA